LTGNATVFVGLAASDIVQTSDIGVTVQAYDANIVSDASYVHTDNNYTTAEKSKLAGVEAGATADQTAAEILTAVKTVDGAASGLDADLLDGLHASSFLQGNQTITLSGDATGSGTTSIVVTVADDSHNHIISNVDGLQAALDGKASTSHTHTAAQITNFDAEVSNNPSVVANTAKLAGIEAGATADQTAAEILTAVKTVDGAGSGLDADLLDGLHASAFALASHAHDYVPERSRTDWNDSTVVNDVIGQMAWQNYGNNHTIFDASKSISPSGTSVNNTNPSVNWSATYPTLMGWNGASTYGVRVDVARYADSADTANTANRAYPKRVGNVDLNFNWSGQSGQPPWLWGGSDGSNMYVYNPSNFNVNYANTAGSVTPPAAGSVGSYMLGKRNTACSFGTSYSSVYACSAYGSYNQLVSGTWRCMGRAGASGPDYVTVFLRIA
jgi:hypothetical protein